MGYPSRILPLLLTTSLLTGCALQSAYQSPTPLALDQFLGQAAVQQRPGETADLKAWWSGFNDPTLTHFVEIALAQNLDIAQAASRVAQSRAALRLAGAALLPVGAINVQGAKVYQSLETPVGRVLDAVGNTDRVVSAYDLSLGASWEADLFGGLRSGRDAARSEYEASEAGVVATRLAVVANAADVYVTIRGIQTRLAVAHQQVDTRRRLLTLVRLQYDRGIAAALQVDQAEAAIAPVEAQIPVLNAGLESAMNALDVLLGKPPGTYRAELTEAGAIPAAPGLGDTGTPADLIRRRPDLIVAERRLAAAHARIGIALAEYYPKVSLGTLLGSSTTIGASRLLSSAAAQALGVVGLRWRLFDFGRVDAQIAVARGREAEALVAYRLAALHATEDVENAFAALVNREAQLDILTQGESALSRAVASAEAAYKAGVVSLIEVLDANSNLLQVRDAKAQAQTEIARAAIASFRSLGGGWDASRGIGAIAEHTTNVP